MDFSKAKKILDQGAIDDEEDFCKLIEYAYDVFCQKEIPVKHSFQKKNRDYLFGKISILEHESKKYSDVLRDDFEITEKYEKLIRYQKNPK